MTNLNFRVFTFLTVSAANGAAIIEPMLVAAASASVEREAIKQVAEREMGNTSMLLSMPPKSSAAWNILQAINARGNT